jgi:DNA-binding response OmpR family regulator
MKVLIADNDWRFAQQATNYLESKAHLVAHKPLAKDTLAAIEHWQCDLVILSAELAQDGLLEAINKMPQRPAVILTGRLDQYDSIWRAWQKGGDDVLMKPILHATDLQVSIVTALESAAAGTRSRKRRKSAA